MKKILMLALVAVIALSALGVGYAMWSDTLYINGTVSTGNLDVQLSGPFVIEDEDLEAGGTDSIDRDSTIENKDVGMCDAWLAAQSTGESAGPNDVLVISYTNG
jgi:hypothetical protein